MAGKELKKSLLPIILHGGINTHTLPVPMPRLRLALVCSDSTV